MKTCTVFLAAGAEIFGLLENAVRTLRQTGYDEKVIVYLVEKPGEAFEGLAEELGFEVRRLSPSAPSISASYSNFGTAGFNAITHLKWHAVKDAMSAGYNLVVYADCDIAFLSNYSLYVKRASRIYDLGVQSEARAKFPPVCCTGFFYMKRTPENRLLLDELIDMALANPDGGHDQRQFNDYLRAHREVRKRLFALPETLFIVGCNHRLLKDVAMPKKVSRIGLPGEPFLFHANWTRGIQHKQDLLKHYGLWWEDQHLEAVV